MFTQYRVDDESERGASPCMEKSFIESRVATGEKISYVGPELQRRAATIIEKAIGGLLSHSFT